jgi:predicted PolB exonuclease-like 3'-5' exonuclease
MKISELIIDIETVPDESLSVDLRPECALGNLKDPVKIEAKVKAWESDGQVKKMSVSPFMCQIVSIQMWSSIENDFIDTSGYSEAHLIAQLDAEIDRHSVTVGHNIIGFDLAVVKARAMMDGSNVYQMWKDGKRDEIDEYCKDDVRATKALYDRIKNYYK